MHVLMDGVGGWPGGWLGGEMPNTSSVTSPPLTLADPRALIRKLCYLLV